MSRFKTLGDLFKPADPDPIGTAWHSALGAATGQWSLEELKLARRSFIDAMPILMPGFKLNWHHAIIADALQSIADGATKKVIVSIPPQHTKSLSCSELFPAWTLGRQNEAIMAAAYSQARANDVAGAVGRWMSGEGYKALFPLAPIPKRSDVSRGWKRMTANFNIIGYEASRTYLGIGVGGSGTGYPRSLGIIDDPVKNYEDAVSAVKQGIIKNWYSSVYGSRENKLRSEGGEIRDIIVMTRWAEDDLAGHLLKREGRVSEGGQWLEINIPAIMDEVGIKSKHPQDPRQVGQALWPEMRDLEKLESQRALAPSIFEALYQGRPSSASTTLFDYDWFPRCEPHEVDGDRWLLSCDLNFGETGKKAKTHSKASLQVWCVNTYSKKAYLVDELWETYSFPECLEAIHGLYRKYPLIMETLIEAKASGPAMIQTLSQTMPNVIAVQPTRSKMSRAGAIAPYCEAGRVNVVRSPMLDETLRRIDKFPAAGTDDSVDALSQTLSHALGPDALAGIGFLQSLNMG